MSAALQVDGLRLSVQPHFWSRRRELLRGVSFAVERGEVFGFLGPNGAGKTTTLKVVLGLLRPNAGKVVLLDGSIDDPAVRARVGFMPERAYYPEHLSGRELVRLHARLAGLRGAAAARRADAVLERVGLREASAERLRTYSKGMLQRVGFAQAMIAEPELLLLDEPLGGLDPVGRREVLDLLGELRAAGATVLFSTHILADVERVCERVAILVRGQVRRTERIDVLLESGGVAGIDVVASGVPADGDWPSPVSRMGERVWFRMADVAAANALLDRLRARGASVVEVTPRRTSLEDVFMQAAEEDPS